MSLALTDLVRVRDLEELRRNFDEPLGLDSSHVVAVLARRKDQLVVNAPFRVPVEERGRRVDVNGRALDERLVTLLRILLCRIPEVPRTDCAPDPVVVLASREDVVLISIRLSAPKAMGASYL